MTKCQFPPERCAGPRAPVARSSGTAKLGEKWWHTSSKVDALQKLVVEQFIIPLDGISDDSYSGDDEYSEGWSDSCDGVCVIVCMPSPSCIHTVLYH